MHQRNAVVGCGIVSRLFCLAAGLLNGSFRGLLLIQSACWKALSRREPLNKGPSGHSNAYAQKLMANPAVARLSVRLPVWVGWSCVVVIGVSFVSRGFGSPGGEHVQRRRSGGSSNRAEVLYGRDEGPCPLRTECQKT